MSASYRSAASAKLGAGSAGSAESVHLVGLALQSALNPALVISRLCSTVSALLRAERCIVIEGSDPADPLFPLVKQALAQEEAVRAEGLHSILCAPLLAPTHPEGVLVAERPATDPFGDSDLKLLATVAPLAALAIQRARIYDRATADALTGLPNRQRFTVELEDAVLAGGSMSLLLADFDHFKDKNDVYGRAVGDRVLAEFGGLLLGRLPASICTARTGEDEFGALMPGTDAAHARDFAEDLRKAANDRIFDEAHEGIHLTVSAGVAEFKPGEMASSLFARAADALAAAKRAGRNRVDVAR
jgi:diguanylate cyclase (GGDEF)-like protein